jgi:uncharacterized membrane protein YcaP (DUF421 family)
MYDARMWADMFHLGIPIAEKLLRPVIVYAVLIGLLRLFGKRELAQLNPFDLVVLLTLSNAVQNAIIGDDNTVVGGVLGAVSLLAVNWVVVRFLYRHESLDRLVEGESDVLIEHGDLQPQRLDHEMITRAELETAARKQGFGSLADVERAVLEPGGGITFSARQPKPEESRHQELLERLDALAREVASLRGQRPNEA